MASYHLKMNVGVKGKGEPHVLYICREGKYKTREDEYEDLVHKEHHNMPDWASDSREFWKAADEYERSNGRSYREFQIALPNELTKEQQIELVKTFVNDTLGQNHPYSLAIHVKEAALKKGVQQPHAHIMFSERKLDGIKRDKKTFFKQAYSKKPELGGPKKNRDWQKKERLEKIREMWAVYQNRALEMHGHKARVDHRSLEVQKQDAIAKGDLEKAENLDRPPETHLGPKLIQKTKDLMHQFIRQAKTPEEMKQKREEYYEKMEPNKKVRNVFYLREYARTNEAIEKMVKLDPVYKYDIRIKEINIKLNGLLSERKALARKVLTPERAELIVQSIYLKGKSVDSKSNFSGELLEHGRAQYEFKPDEKESYFVKFRNSEGVEKIVWGVDLERAMDESNSRIGQRIEIINQGRQPVVVKMAIKNSEGKTIGWKDKQAHRNQWLITDVNDKARLLGTPQAQAQLAKIKEAVLKKNEPLRERLENLEMEIHDLRTERGKVSGQRTLAREERRIVGNPRYKTRNDSLNKLDRSVRQLNRDSATGGGLKVRIQVDDDYKRERDFER